MKTKKIFSTILLVMTSVIVMAESFPTPIQLKSRTIDEPYQDFQFCFASLFGVDNVLLKFTLTIGERNGDNLYRAVNVPTQEFIRQDNEKEYGSTIMDKELCRDSNYVVKLISKYGFYEKYATIRVYRRHDPLGDFSAHFTGTWSTNLDILFDNFDKWLDFKVADSEKTALSQTKMNVAKSRVYLVSREKIVIDANFGDDRFSRYFDITGRAKHDSRYNFKATTSVGGTGRYDIAIDKKIGLYAISHPLSLSVVEQMSMGEYCTQTHEEQILTTQPYAKPTNLNHATDQYQKSVKLTWQMENPQQYDVKNEAYAGKWYVYRRKTGTARWDVLDESGIDIINPTDVFTYEDRNSTGLEFSTEYDYCVTFIPDYWLEVSNVGGSITPANYTPLDEFSVKANNVQIELTSPLYGSPEAKPLEKGIMVVWKHQVVPEDCMGNIPKFIIQRRSVAESNWTQIAEIPVTELRKAKGAETVLDSIYDEKDIVSSCMGYSYNVIFDRGDNVQPFNCDSPTSYTRISGTTKVTKVEATTGSFAKQCLVTWSALQVGTAPTTYELKRRDIASENKIVLTKIQGTNTSYSYLDATCEPGRYYEYTVTAYTDCEGSLTARNSLSAFGFSQSYGTISGMVTYGSGTQGVDSVRVTLTPNNNTEGNRKFFYSAHFSNKSYGIQVPVNNDRGLKNNTFEGDYTIAAWVKPDSAQCNLFTILGKNQQHLTPYIQADSLLLKGCKATSASRLTAARNRWTFVFLTRSGNSLTLGTIDDKGKIQNKKFSADSLPSPHTFAVGLQERDPSLTDLGEWVAEHQGAVSIDEVRVYRHALSDKELLRSYDRMLSGKEKDLMLYWSMNEGYQTGYTYDLSSTNDAPNNAHGVLKNGMKYTEDSPNQTKQVTCYGLTQEDGTYIISGIPFAGGGTNYSITPSKGTHEFYDRMQIRYVSPSSFVYNSVNFQDVSFIPVSGTVRYAGTTIPVDSCTFEIDGVTCMSNGIPVMTDAKGKYTISVPIGDHQITIKRNNHIFANGGKYPAGNVKRTFDKELYNVDFVDTTLVNFVGRIVGGFRDQNLPIGFRQSTNNIGKVQFYLTPTVDGYINAKKTVDGTTYRYDPNDKPVAVASDTTSIQSRSYRGGSGESKNVEECKRIYITTDSITGEFSALIPPLNYKMSAQKLVGKKTDEKIGEVRIINLSDYIYAGIDTISQGKDSVKYVKVYPYHYKYVADYHTKPVFMVNEGKPFGTNTYKTIDNGTTYTINDIYSVNGSKISYKFGYPMFITGDEYSFDIEAYETYVNADNSSAKPDKQPLSGCDVKIANALSSSQALASSTQKTASGTVIEEGTPLGNNKYSLQLDSLGKATYVWCAGLPNFNAKLNHALSVSIQLVVSGKHYDWTPSDDAGLVRADTTTRAGMKGINLGALHMGKKFSAKGPDKVIMVLRDPPGAKSSATWGKGSSTTIKDDKMSGGTGSLNKNMVYAFGGERKHFVTFEGNDGRASGFQLKERNAHEIDFGGQFTGGLTASDISSTTYTAAHDISTSNSPEFVGSWGDVYVSTTANFIFGDAREVYLKPNDQGVSVRDVQGVRDSISSYFAYTQAEIISNILPGYREEIKNLLKDTYKKERLTREQVTVPHYYSNLPEDHPNFGLSNFDKVFGGAEVKDGSGPSYAVVFPTTGQYQDTIQYMHNQINAWENVIRQNEEEKVMMYEGRNGKNVQHENISFGGGSDVTRSYTFSTDSTHYSSFNRDYGINFILNGYGDVSLAVGFNGTYNKVKRSSKTKTDTQTFSFTLSDNNYCDHSVDIYRKREEAKKETGSSKNGWGPIFRTLAGHTYGPYEDGDTARYYGTNKELMAKTIPMEVPQIMIDQPMQKNVPNGGAATFKVKMSNLAYTESTFKFTLGYKLSTNKGNAELSVDGKSIRDGMVVAIPYNKTIEKVVTLKQTDKSILDYSNIELFLRSTIQDDASSHWPVIESVASISANFAPVSTDVTLQVDKNVLTTNTDTTLVFTISDFDIHHEGLKNVQLQYRFANEEWTTLQMWVTDTKTYPQYPSLAEEAAKYQGLIKYSLKMKDYADGNYTFRVVSVTQYGTDGEVTKESEEMSVVKDTKRPVLIAMPTPADGILGIGDVISAEFNKDIASGKITQDDNIEVYGSMAENSNSDHVGITGQNDLSTIMETQNRIELKKEPFTIEMWSRNDGESGGYSLTFGSRMMNLGLTLGRLPSVTMGGNALVPNPQEYTFKHVAAEQLDVKPGEWVFWQFTYKPKDNPNGNNVISLTAFYGEKTKTVFKDVAIPDVISNSKMTIGTLTTGQYADLAIWDHVRGPEKAAQGMQRKSGLEGGLSHYWKLDEGHGSVARDLVGGNDIMLPEHAWFIDNTNFAAHISQDKQLVIPMGDSNLSDDDSYALDFWFKVDNKAFSSKSSLPLIRAANGAIVMTANENRHLTLTTKHEKDSCTYVSAGVFDNDWQHVLLNVQRGMSASVYVNGANQMMLEEKKTPGLGVDSIYFGNGFTGDIDEIRIWRGLLSSQSILDERYNMIDTAAVKELVRYYPFENTTLDEGNQKVTSFSLHNAAEPNGITKNDMKGDKVKATSAPPLKDAVKRSNLPFTFTASDRIITILLDESLLAKLEGQTINMKFKDVPDINGNHSGKISWNCYVRRNPLRWTDTGDISLQVQQNTSESFTREICNHSSKTVNWLLKTPVWLEASSIGGRLEPMEKMNIVFTIKPDIATGWITDNIELTNIDDDMTERVGISLQVIGVKPSWTVNLSDKDFSIPLTARLILDNAYSDDEEDMLAAFVGNECVGIGNVQYNNQRDNYFVNMTIYGGSNQLGKSITFKAWDADRNIIFAPMARQKGGDLIFASNATPYGSYDNPEIFINGEQVEQIVDLNAGWNWVSFFVNTKGVSLNNALSAAQGIITVVKTQNDGAVWNPELTKQGTPIGFMSQKLKDLNRPSMYALYATEPITLHISGKLQNSDEGQQYIYEGWNWLRNPYVQNRTVLSTFSGFNPYEGDALQGRNSYAQWNATYKQWDGVLTDFAAGQGYKYYSCDKGRKPIFEDIYNSGTNTVQDAEDGVSTYNNYGYVNNMLVLAQVMLKNETDYDMDSVVVVAANSQQQTFQTLSDRGYYVLTVASDDQQPFTFQAVIDGKTIPLYAFIRDENQNAKETVVTYEADAIVGTFASPIILSDDKTITGIREVVYSNGIEEIYNLQGQLLYRGKADGKALQALPKGTYIVNGRKVVIK